MFEAIVRGLNGGGQWFCGWAWPMLWQSSIVIAALFLLDLLLRKHVRATVRYALWMLVLIKLMLPPSLCMPTGVGYWCNINLPAETAERETRSTNIETRNNVQISNVWNAQNEESTEGQIRSSKSETRNNIEAANMEKAQNEGRLAAAVTWQGGLFITWVAGVLVLVLLVLQRVAFVGSLIAQSKPSQGRLREIMEACKAQAGVRGDVELRLTENMLSPAACGLLKPVVLMPRALLESLSRERLRSVLMHELMHIRRGDLWVNLVQTALQIAYFYNPFFWAANARIRAVREQAVDEAALASLGDEASQYSRTLVAVAEVAFGQPHLSLRLIGVVESKRSLATRIRHIAQMGIPKSAKVGLVGIVAVVVAGLVLVPMASAKSSPAGFVVKGKVTDAATGKPIAGARVGDDGYAEGKQWTITDANGYYSYLTWYEEHNIECSAPGYSTEKDILKTKLFGREKEKVLDFALSPEVTAKVLPATDGKTAQDLAAEAAVLMNKGQYESAQALLMLAVQKKPDFAEAWVGCGMASVKLKDYDYAKKCYETALALHEKRYDKKPNANDIQQRVFILVMLDREGDAIAMLNSAKSRFRSDEQLGIIMDKGLSLFDEAKNEWGIPGEFVKEGFVGRWKGQAKMVVDFVADNNLPVDIAIDANGIVTGMVGDAKITGAKMKKKGVVEIEWLKHKRRYIIEGGLEGDIIAKEGLKRDKFTMGLDIEGGRIVGSVGTNGIPFGGRKAEIIAHDMSLERQSEREITIDATLIVVDANDRSIADFLKEVIEASTTQGPLFAQVELTEDQTKEFIKRMNATPGAKAFASPRLTVLDGEKGVISVSRTEPAGTRATAASDEFVSIGLWLSLTPRLQKDGSAILLDIGLQMADHVGMKDETGKESRMPEVATESVNTKVRVPTGKRVLLPIAGSSHRQTILLIRASAD